MAVNLTVNFSKEQSNAIKLLQDDTTKRLIYGGQAGGGKSFLIAYWQIKMRLKYPGSRGYIARDTGIKNIEESILVTFFDVAASLQIPFTYNSKSNKIIFPNRSTITLIDAFYYPSDPLFNRLGSKEYTDGAVEEGITLHKKAANILLSRTRYKHDVYGIEQPKQLITCNPGDGWIKDDVIIPLSKGKDIGSTAFQPATLDSNPNHEFVRKYKNTLAELDEYDKARLLHGDWFAQPRTGGEFYKKFNPDLNTVDAVYDPEQPLHITFDFNVNPYMTCCIHQLEEGKSVQIDEICLQHPRNTTRDVCKEFIHRYRNHEAGVFVYGDPAGRHEDTRTEAGHNDFTIIEVELKKYHPSMRVARKAPSVVMRGAFQNAIFDGKIPDVQILIGKHNEKTIADYNFVKEAADGTKAKIKVKDPGTGVSCEKYGHTSDANDYYFLSIFAVEFDTFTRGSIVPVYRSGRRKHKYAY